MSKNIDLNLIQDLSALGLTEKEAKVYIALVTEGEVSAVKLSLQTELHRQFVYDALSSLKEKDLVQRIGQLRGKWRALNPRKLIARAEEQELRAKTVSEKLLALKVEEKGQEFEVIEGTSAFRSRMIDVMRGISRESTVRMIFGEWERYFEHAGEMVHKESDRIRVSKGIELRIIGPESLKKYLSEEMIKRQLITYRILPGLEKNLVNTIIYGNTVDFEIYGKPHVTFSIKNPDVAESQQKFFEALWQMGKT